MDLESGRHLARAGQYRRLGAVVRRRVLAQRRPVAAHRPAPGLELDPPPVRREPQRIYNECDGVRDALAPGLSTGCSGGAYGPEASPLTSVALVLLFVWLIWKAPVRRQTPYLLRERWDEIGGPEEPAKE